MDEIFNSCCKYLKGFACKTEEPVKIIPNSISELSKNFKGFCCIFRKIDSNVFNKKSPLWGMCVQGVISKEQKNENIHSNIYFH